MMTFEIFRANKSKVPFTRCYFFTIVKDTAKNCFTFPAKTIIIDFFSDIYDTGEINDSL